MAKVLLIDDDMDLVEAYRAVLEEKGHTVTMAYSAAEAREELASAEPDVIVLDVMMETQSAGFELAREIHEKHAEIPTLMLTSVNEDPRFPFKYEADKDWLPVEEFLDKPVAPAKLVAEIESVLARK